MKQIKKDSNSLTNSHWKGMTSSIQPISSNNRGDAPSRHDTAYLLYRGAAEFRSPDYAVSRPEFNSRSRSSDSSSYEARGDGDQSCRQSGGSSNPPSRSNSDSGQRPRENGTMSLGRTRGKKEAELFRSATVGGGGRELPPRYQDDGSSHHGNGRHDLRHRETAYPPRDTLSDKVRSSRDDYYDGRDCHESHHRDYQSREEHRKIPRQHSTGSKDSRKYDDIKTSRSRTQHSKMNGTVPDDLYKTSQQRSPNDHIFVQYGKEVRRVLVPRLPIPLETLLQKMVGVFNDTLTPDMVPLKAIYIQDPQTKIFYQLDDPTDLTKGSHVRINEESLIKTVDRGSSQSLEDLNNTSNSSLSSGGFVIPANLNPPPPVSTRVGKSRLSLVEEKLSYITHEMHNFKGDTGSTVSSQTGHVSKLRHEHLHSIIRALHKNLEESRSELLLLKRREQQTRAEMDHVINVTREEITRHIQAALPTGLRRQRMEADEMEAEYRAGSQDTYTNLKDLEKTVEVLKTDVVKRKVKLDPVQLESMETELNSYTEQVSKMNSTFVTLKESLKKVMAEELEIIVNEEQFLEDEEPMLEDATIKCKDLSRIMEALKKVAVMQKERGTLPLSIYTASENDIMEERQNVIQDIAAIQPNHDERVLSIQATEEFRATQKKFVKTDSEFVAAEIQMLSQSLRKTNAFEELERKRDAALREMYTAQPPPHKFGRRNTQPKFGYSSLSKCKSMSSIANADEDSRAFRFVQADEIENTKPAENGGKVKRSRSFSKDKEKVSSEDEKTKKKTVFSVSSLFSKKSKAKILEDSKHNDSYNDHDHRHNGDITETGRSKNGASPPSPHLIPRSYTEGFRRVAPKQKHKPERTASVEEKPISRKGKSR